MILHMSTMKKIKHNLSFTKHFTFNLDLIFFSKSKLERVNVIIKNQKKKKRRMSSQK